MANNADWCAIHEYEDDKFEIECPHCGNTNIVTVYKQDGNIGLEEYYCANCGYELGKIHASNTPRTELKK